MNIINLYGPPSSGKTTAMLGLTYQMKMMGLSVEHTPEFYKDLILEGTDKGDFGGQLLVLGEQNRRLARLVGKNDFAVTDCPLPLIGFYTPEDYVSGFQEFTQNLYHRYNNVANYFIIRQHAFESEKRVHDESQSDKIADELQRYLTERDIPFKLMPSGQDLVERILADMIQTNIITPEQIASSRNPEYAKKFKP